VYYSPSHLVKKFSNYQEIRHRRFWLCSAPEEKRCFNSISARESRHEASPYTLARFLSGARPFTALGRPRPLLPPVMYSHHSIIGLATAIDEYVPMMMPIVKASAKPLNTSPPNNTIATTETKVRPDVITVRESVWLIESFAIWARLSFRRNLTFSRIRSKTTIVSFIE